MAEYRLEVTKPSIVMIHDGLENSLGSSRDSEPAVAGMFSQNCNQLLHTDPTYIPAWINDLNNRVQELLALYLTCHQAELVYGNGEPWNQCTQAAALYFSYCSGLRMHPRLYPRFNADYSKHA